MTTYETALEAGAACEAIYDGRDFNSLSKADKQRYVARFADGVSTYLSALTPPDVAGLVADAITGHFGERCPDYDEGCACCKAWAEYDTLTHLAAENALLREREGWKLVPVEPTPEMLDAGMDHLFHPDHVKQSYAAMLVASPSHQEQNNG